VIQNIHSLDKDIIRQDYYKLKQSFLDTIINGSLIVCGKPTVQEDQVKQLLNNKTFNIHLLNTHISGLHKYQESDKGEK
jgi:hypothetical protein